MVQIFLVRLVLQTSAEVRLHAHHAASLYGLLAAAMGKAQAELPGIPEGMLLDAPEQARTLLATGERYALGLTLLAETPGAAQETLVNLVEGLADLGSDPAPSKPAWGGNFLVAEIADRVALAPWTPRTLLTPIPVDRIERETRMVADQGTATLRFTSPLRCERGDHAQEVGHRYFDRDHFHAGSFLFRLAQRLARWGLIADIEPRRDRNAHLTQNELVWLDLSYGPAHRRKPTGGALGVIRLENIEPETARHLVLGQYARVGEGTKFGFGAYRIEEAGIDPYPCPRANSLLDLALRPSSLSRLCRDYEFDDQRLKPALEKLRQGSYQPAPPTRLTIPKPGGGHRTLAIPAPMDRVLQRAVREVIAPGLDRFFEESSLAYREGLGRERAAGRLRRAFREGFRYALKSDFYRFFDEVDHLELERRLRVYVADAPLVDLVMAWVRSGAPEPGRGLPTGSPLSPLLANVLLDQFDERVARDGGRLVRYADDFMILTRTRAEAEIWFAGSAQEAEALKLTLNHAKSSLVELSRPFTFLGFRFALTGGHWDAEPTAPGPGPLEDLGWEERDDIPGAATLLPGEQEPGASGEAAAIFGPGLQGLFLKDDHLLGVYPGETEVAGLPLQHLSEVLLLGTMSIGPGVLTALMQRGIPVFLADDHGDDLGLLLPSHAAEDPEAIVAQTAGASLGVVRLHVAQLLVAAKIHNYAILAKTKLPANTSYHTLLAHAAHAGTADTLESLRGIEGAAASLWYGLFRKLLPQGFTFPRRVAPAASDPVNMLLNIAHTDLYRRAGLAARAVGLCPSLGFLHDRRAGFLALAADLQEPFRFLMDRVVLESLRWLTPQDFRPTDNSRYPLSLRPGALREFLGTLTRQWTMNWQPAGFREPKSYRHHLLALARNLRRYLVTTDSPFEPARMEGTP